MQITAEMLSSAVRDVVAGIVPEDRVRELVAAEIRERIGTVSIAELAAEWDCDERTVQRKLKKHGVPLRVLSRKMVRVKVADVEALLDSRKVGGAADGKITPFSKPPGRRAA